MADETGNILINGSFELPGLPPGGFAEVTSVPGWTALTGGRIEVWNAHRGIVATDGTHTLELDSGGARDGFFQDVTTVAGQVYTLSFDLQTRPGFAASTQSVEVVWNGAVVATAVPGAAWGVFTVNVTGTGGADRLTIQEVASQGGDGLGAMLDNFRLVAAGPPVPSVSVAAMPATVTEGVASAAVTFTLSAAQAVDTTVTYSTVNGTALAGSDFTGSSAATAVIAAGQTSVLVQVPILNDTVFEPSETFSVRLDGATAGAQVLTATGSATITVMDNDPAPASVTVTATPATITEGVDPAARVIFTLSAVQPFDVELMVSTVDETAISGADYFGLAPEGVRLTIPAGQLSIELIMPVPNDILAEPAETFSVRLDSANTLTAGGIIMPLSVSGPARVTILDNDAPPSNLLVNGSFEAPVVATGGFGAFTSVTGWTALTGGQIEVWNRHNGIVPTDGVQSLELDFGGARDGFFQDVTTVAGQAYKLSFDLQTRPGFAASTQSVEVVWNGVVVGTAVPGTAWGTYTVNVTGTGGADRLTIQEVASQGGDGLGAMLDNFRLVAAGPPSRTLSVSATPATVTEGIDAFASVTFTLSDVQANDTFFSFGTVDGTASGDTDFGRIAGGSFIPAGQISSMLQIPILNDAVLEPSETFTVQLFNAVAGGAPLSIIGLATITIVDNDPPPASVTVAATPATVTEGVISAAVTFTLSAVQGVETAVTYSTVNGTALAGSDFTGAPAATVIIPAGQTSVVVQVPVLNDAVFEPSETFSVRLDGATAGAAVLAATGSALITINDNDPPPANTSLLVNGSFEAPVVATGGFGAFASVTGWTALTGGQIEVWNRHNGIVPTDGVQSLELDFGGARDGFFQDVTTVAGQAYTLSFDLQTRPGFAASTQSVEVVWNGAVVATAVPGAAWGTYTVNVTGTGGADRLTIQEVASQGGDGLGAMLDNFRLVAAAPPVPSVSVAAAPATVTEGVASAAVTFTLSAVQGVDTTVTYSTVNGTALAGSDFTGSSAATAVIAAGQTSVLVQVPILNDAVFEPSETFSVRLDGATAGATALVAAGSATITITDNDPPPANVSITATPPTVTEGFDPAASVTFTLSEVQTVDTTVSYRLSELTARGGLDYEGFAGRVETVVIPAGETTVVAQVPLTNDSIFEPAEMFEVILISATAGGTTSVATGSATITILDDDPVPASVSIVADPATVTEGAASAATVLFTLSAIQLVDVVVTYSTFGQTASVGTDFVGANQRTIIIPAGQISVAVPIRLIDDSEFEPIETFGVALGTAVAGGDTVLTTLGSATITIVDDDPPPASVTVAPAGVTPARVTEGVEASVGLTFTLSAAQTVETTITYSTFDLTAVAGMDFIGAKSATAIIPAGETITFVEVPIIDNTLFEPSEFFAVRLDGANAGAATLVASGGVVVTIVDNDPPPANTNLLVNGSFELPGLPPGGFAEVTSVPGWTALTGGRIEVWNAHRGIVATDGTHTLELDSGGARDGFFQDVTTVAGQVYTLSFDLQTRPGFAASTQSVEVVWNGAVVATAVPGAAWGVFTVNVTGTGGADRLTIQEVASQSGDGLGAMLDNFRLVAEAPAEILVDKPVINEVLAVPAESAAEVSKAVVFVNTITTDDTALVSKPIVSEVLTSTINQPTEASKPTVYEAGRAALGDAGVGLADLDGTFPELLASVWPIADNLVRSATPQALVDHFDFGGLPTVSQNGPDVHLPSADSPHVFQFHKGIDVFVFDLDSPLATDDLFVVLAQTLDSATGW